MDSKKPKEVNVSGLLNAIFNTSQSTKERNRKGLSAFHS